MLFLIKMVTGIEQDFKQTEVKELILKPTIMRCKFLVNI